MATQSSNEGEEEFETESLRTKYHPNERTNNAGYSDEKSDRKEIIGNFLF